MRVKPTYKIGSLFFLFFFFFIAPLHAAFYDGKTKFFTVKTEHFYIHYSEGLGSVADEMVSISEKVFSRLTGRLGWTPTGRTHVVLTDKADSANGMALLLPEKYVLLYTAVPEVDSNLDHYKHYYEFLFTHEFTHIIHIDRYDRLTVPFRKVLGKVVTPNAITPAWMREGMAVYEESLLDAQFGRANADNTEMVLRTAYYENKFPRIDQIAGLSKSFPAGYGAYLFGGRFFKWLAETYGEDRMYEYQKLYASGLWVFSLNNKAKRIYGKSFYKLWDEFREHLSQNYAAQKGRLERKGLTPLSSVVSNKKSQSYYTPMPNGKGHAYYESGLDDADEILIFSDAEKKPHRIKRKLFGQMSFSKDSHSLAFSSLSSVEKNTSHSEVFYYDIAKKQLHRVFDAGKKDTSLRATDPDFSPLDGGNRWLVMVRNFVHTDQLYVFDTYEKKGYLITDEPTGTQFSNPRFSPNGRSIVVSRKDPVTGYRDIVVYSKTGKRLMTITHDAKQDLYPVYSPDGSRIYFTSYRDGVANIFTYHFQEKKLYAVTDVLSGVFQPMPSPDGREVYVRYYGSEKSDIRKFSVKRSSPIVSQHENIFQKTVGAGSTPAQSLSDKTTEATKQTEFPSFYKEKLLRFSSDIDSPDTHPEGSKKYFAFPNVLVPSYLLPNVLVEQSGLLASLTTGKYDPLYRHNWLAYANYWTLPKFVGAGATYLYSRYDPTFFIGGARFAVDRGTIGTTHFFEERWNGYAGMSYKWKYHTWSFRYFYEHRSAYTNLPGINLINMRPYAGVTGQYKLQKYKKFPNSISPEDGYQAKIGLDFTNQVLGSHAVNEETAAYADLRAYIEMPWFDHHVLALRAGGGWAWGDQQQFGAFRLGGPFGEGTGTVPLSPRVFTLRGLPGITFAGDQVVQFSGEYRFPLAVNVNWGIGTWPVFLDKLHMDLFMDAGDIKFRTVAADLFSRMLVSVGGEFKGDFVLGYGIPITARLGYGVILTNKNRIAGLTDSLTGQDLKYGSFYFQVGTAF